MNKRIFIPFFISLAVGGSIMTIVLYISGYSVASGAFEYKVLSDAMTLPGVVLIGTGALIFASRSGVFDIFSYAFTRLAGILAPLSGRSNESFYDFKLRRHRMDFVNGIAPILVGAIFMILALIFLWFFYSRH